MTSYADDAPEEIYGGWPMIMSGLKTWLETVGDPAPRRDR